MTASLRESEEILDTTAGFDPVPLSMTWMLLVALLFGNAIGFSYGFYSDPAAAMVLAGLVALLTHWSNQVLRTASAASGTNVAPVFWAGVFTMAILTLGDRDPLPYAVMPLELGRYAQIGFVAGLLSYLPFLDGRRSESRWMRAVRFAMLTLMVFVTAHDVVRTSPTPGIDTWRVQQAGTEALLRGENPYVAVAVPDSGPAARFTVPYIYPPSQILLTAPAFVLTGDVRYGMVVALLVAGWLMRTIVQRSGCRFPSIVEDAPALVVWTMPKLAFVLAQSWVDPVQFLLICAAALAVTARRPLLVAVIFGVILTAKQTMFWTVGLAGLLLGFDRRQWILVLAVGAASVVPFAIADFARLKYSMFDIISALPDRPDALTVNVWCLQHFGWMFPTALALPMAAAVAVISARRLPRSLPGWALASVTTYAVYFSFNKWAFANYYFLVSALAALAAATATHEAEASRRRAGIVDPVG